MNEGWGPIDSSPLACEDLCSDSHSAVRFSHPCHSPVIFSMAHHPHPLYAREASVLSVPGPCLPWPRPLWLRQRPSQHFPTPGLASLVQLPEPSSQPLLHGGWVLTASSSSFWKADDVAILNSCAPGLMAPRSFPARSLNWHLVFVEGLWHVMHSFTLSSLTQEALWRSCPCHGFCPLLSYIQRGSQIKNMQLSK